MNTNQKISLRILALVASGMALKDAFDAVLGAGSWTKVAGDIWEAFQKKEA